MIVFNYMFETTPDVEEKVEAFLDEYRIEKRFTGRNYLKTLIILAINDVERFMTMKNINDMYKEVAEYLGVNSWCTIRRLSDYACNEFFIRNGNKKLANPPKLLITKAVYKIKFKENFINDGRKY